MIHERIIAMNKTNVTPLFEVTRDLPGGETICLQYARYNYGDRNQDTAFRLIRKDPEGRHKAQRGQAGIATLAELKGLIAEAETAGWGHYLGTMK